MRTLYTAAVLMIVLGGGSVFAEDAKSIAAQGNQKWIHAYDSGDAAALTALYAKDATLLPQGVAQPLNGESSIRKFFDEAVKQRVINMTLPVTDAKMVGQDTLFDAGTWTAEVPGQNGAAATPVSGTYLSVWQQEGGNWRLRADTWNMMPPPPEK
jgi:uncharacterized protein (TIGR02246 family)